MSALAKIEKAGFKVYLTGDSLGISPSNNLTQPQREFLKAHKAEIVTELSTYQKISDWLTYIGEEDQSIIKETLDHCKIDPDTLAYFVARASGTHKPH
jgi:hypothetical protein